MGKLKKVVYLPVGVIAQINELTKDETGNNYGGMQRTLERGAELALAELRGDLPVNGGNIAPIGQGGVENPTIGGYNSLHVVDSARKTASSLRELALGLETAMEDDGNARATASDEEREQARNIALSERGTELLKSARAAQEQHRRNEADSDRDKRRSDRKTSGGAA